MSTKFMVADALQGQDAKYFAEMDACVQELAAIRREMKKTYTDIRK